MNISQTKRLITIITMKMSMRKFRRMIYENHFGKDYLEFEQKKKAVELKIEVALKANDFTGAKVLSEELEALIMAGTTS